ncbi:MAG: type 4b pilus protein PilO2 [Alphaproteobacteria bacterium]
MGSGVVTVGRRQYAVGLYWENSPGGRLAQTAKEAAKQPGQQADFYTIRPGDKTGRVPQFGLGQLAAGHKAGMPVFAACLANQQPGSWGGAFRLREGTVVIVIRDDLIVPDGDQFFTNESEARDRLLQEIGFGGLQRIYAPESWAISGADTMPVSLLMDERRDVTLRLVAIPRKFLIAGAVVLGLLLLALGGGWYYQAKQAEEEAARIAQEDAIRRAKELANRNNPFASNQPQYPPPDRVWEKRPSPLKIIEACQTGLKQIPVSVAGWRLTALKCDGATVNVSWSRDKTMSRPPHGSVVNETATAASQTVTLPALSPRGNENLADSSEVTRRYLAQDWPGAVSRSPDDPLPPPPAGYQGPWNPPAAPWVKRSFTVTVPELPGSLPLYFGTLPGVIINSLTYSGASSSGSWMIEGVIYENRS